MDKEEMYLTFNQGEVFYEATLQNPPTHHICIGHYDNGTKTLIELRSNGKILIRGEEVDDNKEVYRVLREFLGV